MNVPVKVGDRYRCFVVMKPDRGWGGPYGQVRRVATWKCEDCGYILHGEGYWQQQRAADHHEHGHAPCDRCGALLLRRKDGTPRQHAANRCPGKTEGDLIEREFVKNMTAREYA